MVIGEIIFLNLNEIYFVSIQIELIIQVSVMCFQYLMKCYSTPFAIKSLQTIKFFLHPTSFLQNMVDMAINSNVYLSQYNMYRLHILQDIW